LATTWLDQEQDDIKASQDIQDIMASRAGACSQQNKQVQIVMLASTCVVRQACQPTMIRHEQKQSTSIYGNNFSCY